MQQYSQALNVSLGPQGTARAILEAAMTPARPVCVPLEVENSPPIKLFRRRECLAVSPSKVSHFSQVVRYSGIASRTAVD